MRLQLTRSASRALVGAVLVAGSAGADGDVQPDARVGLYQDSDHTTVWTMTSGVNATVAERAVVGARYLVDVVSSASVDVVTQATGRFHDTRHDISGNAGYKDDERSISANYSYSVENDWRSHNAGITATHDFFEHNLVLDAAFGIQQNTITRSHSIGFERELRVYLSSFAATYTLTPRDLLQASLAVSFLNGFQSSPYRYLFIEGRAVLENYPEHRWRHALVLRHHHYFDGGWALRSNARLYTDTYGVEAVTVGNEAVFELAPFDLTLQWRGYAQTRASFYQKEYASVQQFMSIDKELSSFVDVFAGPALGYGGTSIGPFDTLRIDARISGFYFYYFDFARLRDRYGVMTDVGISGSF